MIRCIHISDLHLNISLYGTMDGEEKMNSRTVEGFRLLDFVIETAVKNADILFITGDIFENHSPSNRIRREFEKRLVYCNDIGLPVVYIPGNHDIPKSEGSSHPFISDRVYSLPNVFLIDEIGIKKIVAKNGDIVDVLGLPHMYPKDWKKYGDTSGNAVSNILKSAEVGDDVAIVLGHLSLAGVTNNHKGSDLFTDEFVVPKEVFQSFDKKFAAFLLGHIHQHQWIDNMIWYSGSLFPNEFGEEQDRKGYVYFEIEKGKGLLKRSFVDFETFTKFKTVYIILDKEDKNPTETILKSITNTNVNDSIVRVIYEVTEEHLLSIDSAKIRESLKDTKYFDLSYQITRIEEDKEKSDISSNLTPSIAVEKFCEYKGGDFFDNAKDLIDFTNSLVDELKLEKEQKIRNLD